MRELTATFTVDPTLRFDKALTEAVQEHMVSRAQVQKAIKAGLATLPDGTPISAWPDQSVVTVTLRLEQTMSNHVAAEPIDLDIVFEDDFVLVINKPAGLVVHPGAGNWSGTLVNGLVSYLGDDVTEVGDETRPGLVHRLDKDTTGLMVVAKTEEARLHLSQQLSEREMGRIYTAICWGAPPLPQMTFDAPIGRHSRERLKMAVSSKGRDAVTHLRRKAVITGGLLSHVECQLETGRTHQIRVHMNHAGFPLVGDPQYGLQQTAVRARGKAHKITEEQMDMLLNFPRQALHARELHFIHPDTEEEMSFETPLPDDMQKLLQLFL